MRTRLLKLVCCVACIVFAIQKDRAQNSNQVTIEYPSDLKSKAARDTTSFAIDFVCKPAYDLRLMYCDEATMQARVSKGVCILDFCQSPPFHEEVRVPANATLAQVLEASEYLRLKHWRGQPSLRVIGKRAILFQDEPLSQFLKTKISAGDFILVMPVD